MAALKVPLIGEVDVTLPNGLGPSHVQPQVIHKNKNKCNYLWKL